MSRGSGREDRGPCCRARADVCLEGRVDLVLVAVRAKVLPPGRGRRPLCIDKSLRAFARDEIGKSGRTLVAARAAFAVRCRQICPARILVIGAVRSWL